jgi:hypothetical protein
MFQCGGHDRRITTRAQNCLIQSIALGLAICAIPVGDKQLVDGKEWVFPG